MHRLKNILALCLSLFFSLLFIKNGLATPPLISASQSITASIIIDSLKSKKFACNFTPSLWLKADIGITLTAGNVNIWADQSGNANNATQNAPNNRPSFLDGAMNFNPTLDFDGNNDFLRGNAGGAITTLFLVAHSDISVTRATSGQTIFTANIVNPVSDSYFFSIGSITAAFNNEVITHALGNSTEYRKALIGNSTIPATPHLYSTNHVNASSTSNVYYDGTPIDNVTSGNFINAETNRPYRIGGNLYVWGGTHFNGRIAEILSFPTNLNISDRHIIESYLAIKYGISLGHAYTNSDNQTLWDEPIYTTNISSIGRDDCFGLNQKQTKNTNTGAIITMGIGSIANNNAANSNSFSDDNSFLFWGNDNDDNGVIEEISNELPTGVKKRLDREWKVKNINEVEAVEVQFDLNGINHSGTNAGDFFLLLDEDGDGDFTTGSVQKIAASAYQNNIVSFSNIAFNAEVILSLATEANNAPQIMCPELTLEACPNGTAYKFSTGIQVTDLDNDNVTALITLSGITDHNDEIQADLTGFGSVTQNFSYPSLTITGTISPTQIQTILRTLQFSTTSSLVGVREINILLNDSIENSNTLIKEIQADENLSICCSANAPIISND